MCVFVSVLLVMTISPVVAQLQGLNLSAPGQPVLLSVSTVPPLLKGMAIDPSDPLAFDFLLDPGSVDMEAEDLRDEVTKLLQYFLTTLTIPGKDLWVNLSPKESDRIMPKTFGQTVMGRDVLAQDYVLKQLTSSLMIPDEDLGESFWQQVHARAQSMLGTSKVSINTFHKIWIVPDKATVYAHDGRALILESHLKVMLEEDALALFGESKLESKEKGFVPTQEMRELLLPVIEKEVNEGQHFARLRQIYHAMILATWFKQAARNSLLGQVYVDQEKTKGIAVDDPSITHQIYNQYVTAFNKGVYDAIVEEYDPSTNQIIPRHYFTGGAWFKSLEDIMDHNLIIGEIDALAQQHRHLIKKEFNPKKSVIAVRASLMENMDKGQIFAVSSSGIKQRNLDIDYLGPTTLSMSNQERILARVRYFTREWSEKLSLKEFIQEDDLFHLKEGVGISVWQGNPDLVDERLAQRLIRDFLKETGQVKEFKGFRLELDGGNRVILGVMLDEEDKSIFPIFRKSHQERFRNLALGFQQWSQKKLNMIRINQTMSAEDRMHIVNISLGKKSVLTVERLKGLIHNLDHQAAIIQAKKNINAGVIAQIQGDISLIQEAIKFLSEKRELRQAKRSEIIETLEKAHEENQQVLLKKDIVEGVSQQEVSSSLKERRQLALKVKNLMERYSRAKNVSPFVEGSWGQDIGGEDVLRLSGVALDDHAQSMYGVYSQYLPNKDGVVVRGEVAFFNADMEEKARFYLTPGELPIDREGINIDVVHRLMPFRRLQVVNSVDQLRKWRIYENNALFPVKDFYLDVERILRPINFIPEPLAYVRGRHIESGQISAMREIVQQVKSMLKMFSEVNSGLVSRRYGDDQIKKIEKAIKKLEDYDQILSQKEASSGVGDVLSESVGRVKKVGGIRLDSALLDLQFARDEAGVPLPMAQQLLQNMHIDGFFPMVMGLRSTTVGVFMQVVGAL